MTDTKLRELERRWKETGAVDDEAAYLLERVRVGDLPQERLELAADLGHEACASASAGVADLLVGSDLAGEALVAIGRDVGLRAGVAAARLVLPIWEAHDPTDPSPRQAILAVERLIVEPSAEHEKAVTTAGQAVAFIEEIEERPEGYAQSAAWELTRVSSSPDDYLGLIVSGVLNYAELAHAGEFAAVREALRVDMVPWVLGRGDPVLDRVEARQREDASE